MQSVISALARHAESQPLHCAIHDRQQSLSYAELHAAVTAATAGLRAAAGSTVALAIGYGPAWAVADLAALASATPCVPLPPFFTDAQQAHALQDAGVALLQTDRPDFYAALLQQQGIRATRIDDIDICGIEIAQFRLSVAPTLLPPGTAKVTYTSGTTGTPRGVCLSAAAMENVAHALAAATGMALTDRHVCLLPLTTLLENIGGIYAPLLSGACVVPSPGRQDTDASTIAGNYGETLAGMLSRTRATTAIMIPQMLHALVAALENGLPRPATLRFVAVGGARVPPALLARAAKTGLPVYEGYGLSECASVVALNTPQQHRPGSVGKPLSHVQIDFAADGEILVRGTACLGYTGKTTLVGETWPTGDIGHRDAEGFLHVTGRKKDIFITAFGRNVSPEWVESELTLQPAILQAWVHGEARPWNAAVIVARHSATAEDVTAAIAAANRSLPGYAQVRLWLPAREAFSSTNGELTTNGRLRRNAIAARYAPDLEHLYTEYTCEFS